MPKYVMVATSTPRPGREAEYTEWYDNIHIKDICSLTGVLSGRRVSAVSEASPNTPPGAYLGIYEIEIDDPTKIMAEMAGKAQSGEFQLTDALDPESAQLWFYRQD